MLVELPLNGDQDFWQMCLHLARQLVQQCSPVHDYEPILQDLSLSPLQQVHKVISESGAQQLVVVFPMADRLAPSMLTALARGLESFQIRTVFICVCDPLSCGFGDDPELHGLATQHWARLPAAQELWDSLFNAIVVRARLSLGLPAWLLRALSTEFEEVTACCYTFCKR